jgi:uncharacterized membrane protein
MAKNLSTTVGVYSDEGLAQKDWGAIEVSAKSGGIYLADAALIRREADGTITTIYRQSHHGWGKGAIAGAMVGLVFPPSLIGSAIVGAAGGGIVSRLSRKVDRGDIKDLGEVMDSGDIDIVVVTDDDSVKALVDLLEGATKTLTKASATAEEVAEAMNESGVAPEGSAAPPSATSGTGASS